MNEMFYYLISYIVVIVGIIALVNFLSSGFLLYFIKVKASRGKKVLVINKGAIENYASIGWIEGGSFRYKDRETKLKEKNKVAKRLIIPDGTSPFFRLFGVTCVMVDEAKNYFILPNGNAVSGYDAIAQENLILWALDKPTDESPVKILVIINLIITVLLLFGLVALYVKLNQNDEALRVMFDGLRTVQGTNII